MSTNIRSSIHTLKQHLIYLGTVVEEGIKNSIKAVRTFDPILAAQVQAADAQVNALEVDVEEDCLKILALHSPVASDLRFVVTALKMNRELERIGDLAVKVADKVILLDTVKKHEINPDAITVPADFEPMFITTLSMFSQLLDAFVNEDADLAYRILIQDDEVDTAKRNIRKQLDEIGKNDPKQQVYHTLLLSVARGLERIADHTTNSAEDIIYMLQGRIVRHEHHLL
ncbi:MAG: phosphate signaling complex protein PhoU [Proteobacteria bacterium]|nr:phosphate signaling complex protein PhoU [Pseudomonadota bacterium]MBU1639204.1 phosphate signaling complex protein PhoU [Pseudomonadota bacterium]